MAIQSQNLPVFWFTGLSGAGKTTLALRLFQALESKGLPVELLDGDVIRSKSPQIGFSREARVKHLESAILEAQNHAQAGKCVVASFITPYNEVRKLAREKLPGYIEIFIETPIQICESRDPKGLYKRARSGEIQNFTGISSDFEKPSQSDIVIDTSDETIEESFIRLTHFIRKLRPSLPI